MTDARRSSVHWRGFDDKFDHTLVPLPDEGAERCDPRVPDDVITTSRDVRTSAYIK